MLTAYDNRACNSTSAMLVMPEFIIPLFSPPYEELINKNHGFGLKGVAIGMTPEICSHDLGPESSLNHTDGCSLNRKRQHRSSLLM